MDPLEVRLKKARKAAGKMPEGYLEVTQAEIYKSLAPPEFWERLENFFDKLELDQNTPRHKYLLALSEVEDLSAIFNEMETCSCKIYVEFENEMQEQLENLAFKMDLRMRIIQKHGDGDHTSDDDEVKLKILLDMGKVDTAQREAELVRIEDRLGRMWSMISLLDEAVIWMRVLGASLEHVLAGKDAEWRDVTNHSQILLLPGLEKLISLVNLMTNKKVETRKLVTYAEDEDNTTESSFEAFKKLPPELKHLVLEAAAPTPRIVTRYSKDSIDSLLATNSVTRSIIQSKYTRIVNPLWRAQGINFPHSTSTYVNFKTDTVLKTMMVDPSELCASYSRRAHLFSTSIFDVPDNPECGSLKSRCLRRFTGLSNLKHLAVSSLHLDFLFFDFSRILLPTLQVCCPALSTITFCWTEPRLYDRFSRACDIQFLDFDSNYEDYVWFKWDQMDTGRSSDSDGAKINIRAWKHKVRAQWNSKAHVFRGWNEYVRQGFHDYCERYGFGWTPALRVCLMTSISADGCRHIFSDGVSQSGDSFLKKIKRSI